MAKKQTKPTETIHEGSDVSTLQTNPPKRSTPTSPNRQEAELIHLATGLPEISVHVPEDATLGQVCNSLGVAVTGYNTLREASDKLKPVIGKLLSIVKERRLWKGDFKNFGQFITDKVVREMGLGRSAAYDALKIVTAFPTLTEKDWSRFGGRRLLIASRITSSAAADHMAVLHASLTKTADDFEQEVQEAVAAGRPDDNMVSMTLRVSLTTKQRWNKLIEHSETEAGPLLNRCMAAYKSVEAAKEQREVAA